jgi:hypothetical protein
MDVQKKQHAMKYYSALKSNEIQTHVIKTNTGDSLKIDIYIKPVTEW